MLLGGSRDTLLDGTDFFRDVYFIKANKRRKKEEEMIKKAFKLRSGETE